MPSPIQYANISSTVQERGHFTLCSPFSIDPKPFTTHNKLVLQHCTLPDWASVPAPRRYSYLHNPPVTHSYLALYITPLLPSIPTLPLENNFQPPNYYQPQTTLPRTSCLTRGQRQFTFTRKSLAPSFYPLPPFAPTHPLLSFYHARRTFPSSFSIYIDPA